MCPRLGARRTARWLGEQSRSWHNAQLLLIPRGRHLTVVDMRCHAGVRTCSQGHRLHNQPAANHQWITWDAARFSTVFKSFYYSNGA